MRAKFLALLTTGLLLVASLATAQSVTRNPYISGSGVPVGPIFAAAGACTAGSVSYSFASATAKGVYLASSTEVGVCGMLVPGANDTYTSGASALRWSNVYSVLGNFSGALTLAGGTLLTTSAGLTDGAAAEIATMTNGPVAGNPTKWIPINDNGTTRYIPAW